jgi:hypothetical protein
VLIKLDGLMRRGRFVRRWLHTADGRHAKTAKTDLTAIKPQVATNSFWVERSGVRSENPFYINKKLPP